MKNLHDFISSKYISLKGLDEEVVERLSNLDGQMINECDCGCCCCEPTCGYPEPYDKPGSAIGNTATNIAPPAPVVVDPFTSAKQKFYSNPKVYDLLDIHIICDYKNRFLSEYQRSMKEPILIYGYGCPSSSMYNDSQKLHDDILTICSDFEFLWPVLLFRDNGDVQLFAAKKFGSNGAECSIKSSLIEAADILSKLEKRKELKWAQVLDVSIDNLDDLYDFLFTVVFENEKYDKELEAKR